jgi:hypothetical protein
MGLKFYHFEKSWDEWCGRRLDNGTAVSTFNNIEISVAVKPESKWRAGLRKDDLISDRSNGQEQWPSAVPRYHSQLLAQHSGQR